MNPQRPSTVTVYRVSQRDSNWEWSTIGSYNKKEMAIVVADGMTASVGQPCKVERVERTLIYQTEEG